MTDEDVQKIDKMVGCIHKLRRETNRLRINPLSKVIDIDEAESDQSVINEIERTAIDSLAIQQRNDAIKVIVAIHNRIVNDLATLQGKVFNATAIETIEFPLTEGISIPLIARIEAPQCNAT